jgi:adenylate cyclase
MKDLIRRISLAGIDKDTDSYDAKYIKMTNYQALIVIGFMIIAVAQLCFYLPVTLNFIINCLVFLLLLPLVFVFNHYKHYLKAKYFLALGSIIVVSLNALEVGGQTDNHLFLMVIVIVTFFYFKELTHILIVAAFAFAAFTALEIYFFNHPGRIDAGPELIGFLRILSVLNMFGILFFITAHNFKMVRKKEKELRIEQEKVESLLLNILPPSIAIRLKQKQEMIADKFDNVTVLLVLQLSHNK